MDMQSGCSMRYIQRLPMDGSCDWQSPVELAGLRAGTRAARNLVAAGWSHLLRLYPSQTETAQAISAAHIILHIQLSLDKPEFSSRCV